MNKTQSRLLIAGVAGLLTVAGYFSMVHRPYEEQKYITVESHETLILVPLDGNTMDNQAKLRSKDYYEKYKVASKRVPLKAKWHKTGRLPASGKWTYPYDVIKVSRAPITLDWTDDSNSGTSNQEQALRAQTKDDIGFRQGFTIQANVTEEQVSAFAYNYPKASLKTTLDNEVRPFVETEYNKLVKGFSLVELSEPNIKEPELTNEKWIFKVLEEKVSSVYSEKGITIANLGPKDRKIFNNKNIQTAIDTVYITNQKEEAEKKEREIALKSAENKRNIEAEDAKNKREIREKENESNLLIKANAAKTERDILTADAIAQANANRQLSNSLTVNLLELKKLEIQAEVFNKKWDGAIPVQYGQGSTPSLLKLIKE
ncbi:MAG: hypothetical protein ACRCW9_06540 [Cetobacterium sp.]